MRAGMAYGATRSKQKDRAAGATRSKKKERKAGQKKGGNPDEEGRKERNRRRVNPSLETNTSWFDDVSVTFLL